VRAIVTSLILTVLFAQPARAQSNDARELWLYYPCNFQVAENVDKLEAVWSRAAKAGYTHVLVVDSKFAKLGDVPDNYFKNLSRAKEIAARLKLKLVPGLFSVGYSNDLLWHDPNLAEGLPVKDALFVVRGGEARVEADPPVSLDKPSWKDDTVALDASTHTATLRGKNDGNSRLSYALKLPTNRSYHVSVRIKTENFKGQPEVKALGAKDGRTLNWANLGVKPTQDWTEHHAVFNTLDNGNVNLYFGVWGGHDGVLQWKDWKIEEAGPTNLLRRPGTPLVVKDDKGGKAYEEGRDFEKLVDPLAGTKPWNGEFDVWHPSPAIKAKNIPDGTRLRVSWYHAMTVYDGQVSACIAEPKLDELLADQSKRMKQALGDAAAGWMMSHDEFRTLGWCKACEDSHHTPGELLAANVKKCIALLRPGTVYVWNDMFDPHHNAVPGPYYLVNGPWTGSWEGLDKDVVIMNWNHGKRDQSLKFFAGRGHKQVIATYYDDPDFGQTKDWLKTVAQTPAGVVGYMYTTWRGDYSKMEEFAKLCRGAGKER
jgi:hypothetical protein